MKLTSILPAGLSIAMMLSSCAPKGEQQNPDANDSTTVTTKVEKIKTMPLQPQTIAKDIEYTSTLKAYEDFERNN